MDMFVVLMTRSLTGVGVSCYCSVVERSFKTGKDSLPLECFVIDDVTFAAFVAASSARPPPVMYM